MPEIYKLVATLIGLHGWIVLTLGQLKGIRNRQSGTRLGLETVTLLGFSMTVLALIWWFDWPLTLYTLGLALLLFAGAATTAALNVRNSIKRGVRRPSPPER